MKILITTHYLDNYAGTELVTLNLSKKLKEKGHDVFVFSPIFGKVANEIRALKIPVVGNLMDYKSYKFDIIHAQHNVTAIIARSLFPKTPMIFMSHGILPELEQPPSVDLGIAQYIAVSEEVKDNLTNNYSVKENKIKILRNFVDTARFRCKKPVNLSLKKLLVLSNHYSDKVKEVIEKSCGDLGIDVVHIGRPDNPVSNVEDYINDADIVITLGKGALEAMACERNVIVYDMHGGDGFVDENNFYEIRKNNFSGRKFRKDYTREEFKNELNKYNPDLGRKLRKLVIKENSLDLAVDRLTDIYLEAKESANFVSQIKNNQLFNEICFLEKNSGIYYKKNLELTTRLDNAEKTVEQKERKINDIYQLLQKKEQELISSFYEIIKQKEIEINLMKSSKFWKFRNHYLKVKKLLFLEKHDEKREK